MFGFSKNGSKREQQRSMREDEVSTVPALLNFFFLLLTSDGTLTGLEISRSLPISEGGKSFFLPTFAPLSKFEEGELSRENTA